MGTLYDSSVYHSSVGVCPNEIWDSKPKPKSVSVSRLSSLFRPPQNLLFKGSFEDAKTTSSRENLWLLVNLQSTTEFASHTLNRDLWSDEAVSQAVESSFILWQVYDHTIEGQKISSYYKIDSVPPVVLLIDPISGQNMCTWRGEINVEGFLRDLIKYRDAGPQDSIASRTSTKRIKTEKICFPYSHTADQVMATMWGRRGF